MEEFLPRKEHEEFAKRMEEEDRRQNHRIGDLEEAVKQQNKTLILIERLANSMESMQKEQSNQGKRLDSMQGEIEEIKGQDGEKWRTTVGYVISLLIGAALTALLKQIGL